MKKIIMLIVLSLMLAANAMVWGHADFEDGTLGGATSVDQDGDTYGWESYMYPVKDGTYGLRSVSEGLTPDNWIITPQIYVEKYSAANYPHVKFNVAAEDPMDFEEHFQVLVSFTNSDIGSFTVILEDSMTSADWKEVDVDLSPYFGEYQWEADIYVAIRHYNSDNKSALIIDDFFVYSIPDILYEDPAEVVDGVVEPYSDVFTRWNLYDRTAYDQNWNLTNDYESVRMHYIITDETGEQPEQWVDVNPSTNLSYDWCYDHTFTGMPMGTFMEYWLVVTDGSGYGITGESNHHFVEWGEVNFEEGFEYSGPEATPPDYWMPTDWITLQTGAVTSSWDRPWEVDVAYQNVYEGEYSVTSASQNNFGEWETINYLISPRFRINGTPELKYYVNAQTLEGFSEKWSVHISTAEGAGTNLEDYTELSLDSIICGADDNEWFEKKLDLSAYKDQYVRLMWKHHFTDTGAKLDRFLNIDDISVAEFPALTIDKTVGNACDPDMSFTVKANATDYSGINNLTLYYTIDGGTEVEVIMTDNGDDTFTAEIPAQSLDTRAKWYIIATDDSAFGNQTRSDDHQVIWFEDMWAEWGSTPGIYTDYPDGFGTPWIAAMDWNFGEKGFLHVKKIEVGTQQDETVTWQVTEFDGVPTDNVIGTLEGVADITAGSSGTVINIEDDTVINGHVAVRILVNGGYLYLDESGDKTHAWQYTTSSGWNNNNWGAFYIRMYVQSDLDDIDQDAFIANTTQLCQNYPNPFNPTTSISFFNKDAGDVKLTVYNVAGEEVAKLVDGRMDTGYQKIQFDASDLNSGVYYYTLVTPEKTLTKKMVLVK